MLMQHNSDDPHITTDGVKQENEHLGPYSPEHPEAWSFFQSGPFKTTL